MPTQTQLNAERLKAMFSMIVDDGAQPPGQTDPRHVEAVRGAGELGQAPEVARAHAEGRGPPDWASGHGNGGGR